MTRPENPPLQAAFAFAIAVAIAVAWNSGTATAQQAKNDSVRERQRPEFDPMGFYAGDLVPLEREAGTSPLEQDTGVLGSFLVFPKIEIGYAYDDNVLRLEEEPGGDHIATLKPEIKIESDWANHELALEVKAEIARYADLDAQDYEDAEAQLRGRLDVTEDLRILARGFLARRHEDRLSIDDPGAAFEPTVFSKNGGQVQVKYRTPDIAAEVSSQVDFINFEDSQAALPTGIIENQDDRDATIYTQSARLGYTISPGTEVFGRFEHTLADHDDDQDDGGFDRNEQTYEFLAGFTWDASPVTFFEIGFGVISAQFEDRQLEDITDFSFTQRTIWNATDLLTVTSSAEREIIDSFGIGFGGIERSTLELGLDWEAMYNLILGAEVGWRHDIIVRVSSPADPNPDDDIEDIYRFEFNARYLLNEYSFVDGSYQYQIRESDLPGSDFTNNLIMFNLGLQL